MASTDSQVDKPQRGRPKRVELPDVNINTGAQSINTGRASLIGLPVVSFFSFLPSSLILTRAEEYASSPTSASRSSSVRISNPSVCKWRTSAGNSSLWTLRRKTVINKLLLTSKSARSTSQQPKLSTCYPKGSMKASKRGSLRWLSWLRGKVIGCRSSAAHGYSAAPCENSCALWCLANVKWRHVCSVHQGAQITLAYG